MRKLRPIRGKMLPTIRLCRYGWVDEKRAGKGWWEPETKAYDSARWGMREYMIEHDDIDPEDEKWTDCPDDFIESYANGHELLFDSEGHIYERVW